MAAGRMLSQSRLTLVLLAAAVSCALAQHAPPVSELQPQVQLRAQVQMRAAARGSTWRRRCLCPELRCLSRGCEFKPGG